MRKVPQGNLRDLFWMYCPRWLCRLKAWWMFRQHEKIIKKRKEGNWT